MKALIVSLRFNPGHYSHLIAFYKLFNEAGFQSALLIDKRFNEMNIRGEYSSINTLKVSNLKGLKLVVFCFPSIANIWISFLIRVFTKAKIIYVFHEPIGSLRSFKDAGFTNIQLAKIFLIKNISILTILLSDIVVLPSEKAYMSYANKYVFYNSRYYKIPLLFIDEFENFVVDRERVYISYIGTVAPDHAFDRFIDFIIARYDKYPNDQVKYLIATSSSISNMVLQKINILIKTNIVDVVHGRYLTNEEINHYFKQSILIWNAYNRSTQSGVLAKAYMFGTPAIGLRNISDEFIESFQTGILVSRNDDFGELDEAVIQIRANLSFYCNNARNYFLNKFYYKRYINNFKEFLNYD